MYGRKSGASTIVTPWRNGASSTLIGVPKTVSPAGTRWMAWPQVANPLMKLVETTSRSGSPPFWRAAWSVSRIRSVEPYADGVGRASCWRAADVVGLEDRPQPVHLGRDRGVGSLSASGPGRSRSSTTFSMSSTMFWSWTVMLKSNGRLDSARHHLCPGRLGRPADLHGELEGLAILGPGDADRRQTGLIDFGAGAAVADQVDGRAVGDARKARSVPAVPRGHVDRRRAGRVAADLHVLGVARRAVDELETSWFIRNVASASVSGSSRRRDRRAERGGPRPVLVGVHQEVDPLDRDVRQSGHERVAVGEPVADRDGNVVACFDPGLLGSKKP